MGEGLFYGLGFVQWVRVRSMGWGLLCWGLL
jgi:hypothetical protein